MATTQASGGFMGHVDQMLQTHPSKAGLDAKSLTACIQACFDCAQACISCADACLGEDNVQQLVRCIRLNLDCANLCDATGKILSRQTAWEPTIARAALQACITACRTCAEECEKHGQMMAHCKVCADACRACERACTA
ncbi:MAG: four-helix bundle copper-binding protein, partial [Myxococcales bacterium]